MENKTELNQKFGYIKLYRSIQDHWIWKDEKKLKWWMDILLCANHKDKQVHFGFEIVECKRGQVVRSLKGWAERWGVDRSTVHRFLKMLQNDFMLTNENLKITQRLTVCNYDSYNDSSNAYATAKKQQATRTQHGHNTNNNANNANKEKNEIAFDDFWKIYNKSADKTKCKIKFLALPENEIEALMIALPIYIATTPDKQFRKNPLTWINGKCWNDIEMLDVRQKLGVRELAVDDFFSKEEYLKYCEQNGITPKL